MFRTEVVPLLRTYPFIRIWHAGCSTGEEVYSTAIVLEEEGLLDRARIYATDINDAVLQQARGGIFPLNRMQEYTENYIRAGGRRSFSEYYTAKYDGALFSPSLTRNVVFSQHNLVTDRSFSEFNVIFCRNVLHLLRSRPAEPRALAVLRQSSRCSASSRWAARNRCASRSTSRATRSCIHARSCTGRCNSRGIRDHRRRDVMGRTCRRCHQLIAGLPRDFAIPVVVVPASPPAIRADAVVAASGPHVARRLRGGGQSADRRRQRLHRAA